MEMVLHGARELSQQGDCTGNGGEGLRRGGVRRNKESGGERDGSEHLKYPCGNIS